MNYWEIDLLPDLYNAVVAQDTSLVEKLLANGVKDELWNYYHVEYNDGDANYHYPLEKAIELGNLEIVKRFIDCQGNPDKKFDYIYRGLEYAASIGSKSMFTILFEHLLEKREIKISGEGIQEILCCACRGGNLEIIGKLLAAGCDVNYLTYNMRC